MIRILTDENFNRSIFEGVRQRLPSLDILRVQDAGLRTLRDEIILEFAAHEGRILLSHDLRTMKPLAEQRILSERPMPGLLLIRQDAPIVRAIDDIVLIAECSRSDEWNQVIQFLPL